MEETEILSCDVRLTNSAIVDFNLVIIKFDWIKSSFFQQNLLSGVNQRYFEGQSGPKPSEWTLSLATELSKLVCAS